MNVQWTSHLKTEDEKNKFRQQVKSSAVLERLNTIIDTLLTSANKAQVSDYELASWAFKQADSNGFIRALRQIKEIIDTKE